MPLPSGRLVLLVAAATLLGAAPAFAATKSAKSYQPLDLELRKTDLRGTGEQRRPRGYAATMSESPWSILADDVPPVGGLGIPQFSDSVRENPTINERNLSLKGLLDGETITLLRIRLAPD